MKKSIILLTVALSTSLLATAQPWMEHFKGKPAKYSDVVAWYKSHPELRLEKGGEEEEKENRKEYKADKEQKKEGTKTKIVRESKDYLFDRWAWYTSRHLDENGYIVNPIKNWEAVLEEKKKAKVGRKTTATNPIWHFQGPNYSEGGYSGIGRVNVVRNHPTNPNTLYIGSSGGGPWKSTDGGATWSVLYNDQPTLGVTDIAINPLNASTMYLCTGDANAYDNPSMGLIKSYDGGNTWSTTGITYTATDYTWLTSIIINKRDTNTLFLASTNGLLRSYNGGADWEEVRAGSFKQVLYHPTDTNTIYACQNISDNAQIVRSTNGGDTWTVVTSLSESQRIALAVSPASPNLVKALVSKNGTSGLLGVYTSTNSGASFTTTYEINSDCSNNLLGYDMGLPSDGCNGQGWYDLCIAINPTDANKIIIGGINNYYTTNGGTSWNIVTTWWNGIPGVATVHADKHFLTYNPLDNTIYQGCDGGVYKCSDPTLNTWTDISNGLGITQFYRLAIANSVPFAIGGAQDNGTKHINNPTFTDLTGGDGMQCQIDYDDAENIWYTATQYGNINITTNAGASFDNISDAIPDTESGIWITPYIIHPQVNTTLLAGITRLYVSYDRGVTWDANSPVFSADSKLERIAMCPTNGDYIYVLVNNNTIRVTTDFGGTWSVIPGMTSGNVSDIKVEPKNPNILWVTYSGYGSTKVRKFNRTTNTWTNHNTGIPNVPVNCIVIDSSNNTKYVGTDIGVYYLDTTMTTWQKYADSLPVVEVTDLAINYTSKQLWAATYGRGMWATDKKVFPSSSSSISLIPYAGGIISTYPNPNMGTFTINTTHSGFSNKSVSVRLYDANGKIAYETSDNFDSAGNLKINTNKLPSGSYICETSNSEMTARVAVTIF